jgi:Tol biopolymer transport system component/tRNA A-37 threonylcarbamoyl transferase component Bud32
MPLSNGTRFGAYEIISSVGAGGMGEVYRARDARLQRDVAIKILPEALSHDRSAVSRFQREAQAASALNHPHILSIYEVGRAEERDYIAMELIAGETLRDRIARDRELPSMLDILIQVGDALSRAHEASIVHRDLKPDNIMVTPDGYAKVLDFGLAKLLLRGVDSEAATEVAPRETTAETRIGTFIGTAGYASPEQARGELVDARSDIFSFGCIAFEAMTGERAFRGDTALQTLTLIATVDPAPLRKLNPRVPAVLQRIVSRCLAKNRDDRYPSMNDAVVALRRVRDGLREGGARRLPVLTQLTFDKAIEQFPAISPDGARVVFSRDVGRVRKLFLTVVSEGGEEPITDGPHDDIQPAWSPAGDKLLFVRSREPHARVEPSDVFGRYVGGDVWLLDLATGKTSLVVSDAANPSWSPDGARIAFDARLSGAWRIWLADARGRNPVQATTDSSDAIHHVRPRWSPDGRRIVFQNLEGTKFDVRVADLETKKMTWVTNDYTMDLHPVWSPDGEAIYFSSYRGGGINVWRIPVDDDGTPLGSMEQVTAGPGHDVDLDVAQSGRLVCAILKQNADIWRLPVDPSTGAATGAPEPVIATTRENTRGAWSPDGASIAFSSDRSGAMNLWLLDGSDGRAGRTRPITRGAGSDYQPNWSPDGRTLAFFSGRAGALDIWRVDVAGGEMTQLTHGEGVNINPFFSPDGARIAFQSDRDGRLELWSMNADGSDVRQLTEAGVAGHFVRWTRGGTRIIFRSPTGPKARTMSVPAGGGDAVPTAEVIGGAHMSLSPDESMIMDVVGHRVLWVSPLAGGEARKVFEFDDADSRIDYPVWSPDGRWILFDRFTPHSGDVWMVEP